MATFHLQSRNRERNVSAHAMFSLSSTQGLPPGVGAAYVLDAQVNFVGTLRVVFPQWL